MTRRPDAPEAFTGFRQESYHNSGVKKRRLSQGKAFSRGHATWNLLRADGDGSPILVTHVFTIRQIPSTMGQSHWLEEMAMKQGVRDPAICGLAKDFPDACDAEDI